MRKTLIMTLALMTLVLALAACGGKAAPTAAPTAVPAAKASTAPQPTAVPATKATVAPAPTAARPAAAPTQEDTLDLQSRDTGLDKLKSYRTRWQAEWRSTEAGKTETGKWDFTEEYTAQPEAFHFIWSATGAGATAATAFEVWRIGDTSYMQTTEPGKPAECIAISSSDQDQSITRGMFNPNSLGSLRGAKLVGIETVNGIRAKHYRYDEKMAALLGASKVSGDIWVALDGGYIVKDTATWTGSSGIFGGASKGAGDGKWTWELTDANQPFTIKPPANCASPSSDLPILPDAKEKTSMGTMLMYKTSTKIEDAVAFYKKQMPAAGWKLSGENALGGQMTQLTFEKEGKKAQLMLTTEAGATQVLITTEK